MDSPDEAENRTFRRLTTNSFAERIAEIKITLSLPPLELQKLPTR